MLFNVQLRGCAMPVSGLIDCCQLVIALIFVHVVI